MEVVQVVHAALKRSQLIRFQGQTVEAGIMGKESEIPWALSKNMKPPVNIQEHDFFALLCLSLILTITPHCLFLPTNVHMQEQKTINVSVWPIYFLTAKSKSGLINPFPLMQSKRLHPPHIMFHPASPTVMASQIGLSWGGLGLLCSCCCLIWGLGELQVLTWPDLKDSHRHINILYGTLDRDANESLALQKRSISIC